MNCPDAFTALAERQAFQRERACERTLEGPRRGRRAIAPRSAERRKAQGETNVVVAQTRKGGRGGRAEATLENEERRELVIAYYFWACKETSGGEGTREGSFRDFGSPLLRWLQPGRRFAESFPVFLTRSRDFLRGIRCKERDKGSFERSELERNAYAEEHSR